MKKHLTAAGLALRLTFAGVAVLLAVTAALQWAVFLHDRAQFLSKGFEWLLDERGCRLIGLLGQWAILGWCLFRCGSSGTQATLRRLGIRDGMLTALWGLVFTGYYLLAWAVQLVTVLGLYRVYAQTVPVQSIDLLVAAYRSHYFHSLLPLAEGLTWLRSGLLCLTMGSMTAMTACQLRMGSKPWLLLGPAFLTLFLPRQMGQTGTEITLCVLLAACLAGQLLVNREVARNED